MATFNPFFEAFICAYDQNEYQIIKQHGHNIQFD